MSPMVLMIVNLGVIIALAAVMVVVRLVNPRPAAPLTGATLLWKLVALGIALLLGCAVYFALLAQRGTP